MSDERVQIQVADHVAVVTLNRPEKHNALDLPMFDAITAAAVRLQNEPGVRAVVLHGEGKSFCSGLDFMAIAAAGENGSSLTAPLDQPSPNYFQRAAYEWIRVPVPVIAAIHGNCFGGGLQIALAADIRVCAADAKLSVMETKWGLIPDMAITRTLTRLTGIDVAKELTYTARIIEGTQARELGLVTRISEDPLGDASALAAEIATKSPDAIRAAKRLFDQAWTGTPEETLGLEASLQRELVGAPNQIAAVTAGFTKQPAEFVDPR